VAEFNDPDVRELAVGKYRLIYRVRQTKVSILAFMHGARDLAGLLDSSEQ
jgi:plasmid stabilization system protein ParE